MTFKVIIAGAGIAGLTLAGILEKSGIDFILLEAYSTIAPQLGASIGLLPNGLRILDQLGCYEKIKKRIDNPYQEVTFHASNGQALNHPGKVTQSERLETSTGYPCCFLDRQMVLQELYDNIQDKSKLITGKRVERVALLEAGVEVHTKDGSTFTGDVLVGADGIHSKVRQEMWRVATHDGANCFDKEKASRVKSNSKAIFGISKRPMGFPQNATHATLNDGRSYLVIAAPQDRVFWFLFHSMDAIYDKDIPRFTKEDEKELAEKYTEDHVSEDIKFGEIYERRIMTTLLALEGHIFKRWYYKRIFTIGDSAHKVHPITKQGGNGAIESAAKLANALMELSKAKRNGTLREQDIEETFRKVQEGRFERMASVVKQGEWTISFVYQQIPFAPLLARLMMPIMGHNIFYNAWMKLASSGALVEGLRTPDRPHTVPYLDEIRPDHFRSWAPWLVGAIGLLLVPKVLTFSQTGWQ